jgi:hypothetical protein
MLGLRQGRKRESNKSKRTKNETPHDGAPSEPKSVAGLVAAPSLLFDPRIFQPHAAAFEVGGVPRGQDGIAGVHDGGDLRVQVWDRSALGAAAGCDARKRVCGVFVKGH